MLLKKKYNFWAGILFVAMFLLALFSFASFAFLDHTNAEGASARLNVGVNEVISIAIDADDVNFSITPEFADTKSGTFGMSSTTVKVYTNSDGYKLYMSNKDANNALSHTESSITDKISSLTVSANGIDDTDSTDSFPVNSWGYSLDTGATKTYSAIPTSTVLLKQTTLLTASEYASINSSNAPDTSTFTNTNGPNSNKPQSTDSQDYDKLISTTVTFGAKVDTSIASGKYSDVVVFDVTGSNVGPEKPGTSVESNSWVQTATVTAEDTNPLHAIQKYEYYIVKSDKAYTTSDADLIADAETKIPASNVTANGYVNATSTFAVNSTYQGSVVLSGDANISSSGTVYADGIYYVYIRSVDDNNNASQWANAEIVKLDNTKPAVPAITRTAYNSFSYSTTDNVRPTQYIAVPCVTSTSMTSAQCIANATMPGLNNPSWTTSLSQNISDASTQVWLVYARDEAGNVSDHATIESFVVSYASSEDTNVDLRLESNSGTQIALGATVYALKDTPIFINATTDGTLDYVCTSSSTVPCISTNITNNSIFPLSNNVYVHAKSTVIGIGSITSMQDMTASICNSVSAGFKSKLIDTRDDHIYTIAKLPDGNCWMTQNLSLYGNQILSSGSTNLAPGTAYSMPSSSNTFGTSDESLKMYNGATGSYIAGNSTSTGSYYNGRVANALSANTPIEARNYPTNICPKGWTLPTQAQMNAVAPYYAEFLPAKAGYYDNGSLTNSNNNGYWWSRTASSATNFNYLSADTSVLSVNNVSNRLGLSIRCLAKTDNEAPSTPVITTTSYDTFTISSTDNVDIAGYYIEVDNNGRFDNTGYQTSNVFTITQDGAHTYYIWVVDTNGNLSERVSVSTHTLTMQSDSLATINVRFNDTSGAYIAQNLSNTTTSKVIIDGAQLYITATPSASAVLTAATFNGTSILSNVQNGGAKVETMPSANVSLIVESRITDTEKPVVSISQSAYNAFNFTVTDNIGATAYCIIHNTSSADSSSSCTDSSWISISSTTNSTITYTIPASDLTSEQYWHVYAKDAASNVSVDKAIRVYKITQSATNATLNVYRDATTAPTGSDATAKKMANTAYALDGTKLFVEATPSSNYSIYSATYNSMNMDIVFQGRASDNSDWSAKAGKYVRGNSYTLSTTTTITVQARATLIQDVEYLQDVQKACANNKTPAASVKIAGNASNYNTLAGGFSNGMADGYSDTTGASTGGGGTNGTKVPEAQVKDRRDGKTYLVRKLADGKCWMVQNLEFDITANYQFTTAFSDVTTTRTPVTSASYSTATLSTSTGAWVQNDNNARSWNPSLNSTYRSKLYFSNASGTFTNTASGVQTERWGNYYNWRAATAGVGTSSSASTTITESICPSGFKLPVGNTSTTAGSFYKLATTYGIISSGSSIAGSTWTLYMYPMSFVPAGYYTYNGGLNYLGSRQLFWSSTASSTATTAYDLTFYSGNVYPGTGSTNKGHGFSVRCVSS